MILGDGLRSISAGAPPGGRSVLDDLLRRACERHPDAVALVDPPNRAAFTDGPPRQLTYAEADRVISALARLLRRMGLETDDVVAIQLPNTVESVLALLAVLRAGMIATPVPLLWRRAEQVAALSRVDAKAMITCSRVDDTRHGDMAMHVAVEIFSMRAVCAFGASLSDGVIPLDDLFQAADGEPPPPVERSGNPAAHVAVITWDVAIDGPVPVARSHTELMAGGLALTLEADIGAQAVMLATVPATSFVGLATTVVPWLLVGGTLALHQPFEPEVLAAQRRALRPDKIVVPGPLVAELAASRLLGAGVGLDTVIGIWRAPERLSWAAPWPTGEVTLVDVAAFGEVGLVAGARGADGKPAPIPSGAIPAPRSGKSAIPIVEVAVTEAGTVALRGPMVPRTPYPPGATLGQLPYQRAAESGFVDSGYACRLDPERGALTITAPPPGTVSVGGYRFLLRDLETAVTNSGKDGTLLALPDALAGHRLAGSAPDPGAVRMALDHFGINPLIVGAFDQPAG